MSRHVEQTMTEAPASGGAYRDYLRFTRPAVARQMRAFGLEFEFCAAERDRLRLAQPCTFSGDVLDLVGGYGTSLFGHNHPELVAVAQDCLSKRKPFSAHTSVRSSSAKLAARLSIRRNWLRNAEHHGGTSAYVLDSCLSNLVSICCSIFRTQGVDS